VRAVVNCTERELALALELLVGIPYLMSQCVGHWRNPIICGISIQFNIGNILIFSVFFLGFQNESYRKQNHYLQETIHGKVG
jgi:hypothetical protein